MRTPVSTVTVSVKRNRSYPRSFDWDEARRLRATGKSWNELARHFNVSESAIRRVVIPGERERINTRVITWVREHRPHEGVCPDCGGTAAQAKYRPGSLCRDCRSKRQTTTARETTLQCSCCRLWLPDESFPRKATANSRRQRHSICTPCGKVMKRDWRAANAERERAKERERKRRARAAS